MLLSRGKNASKNVQAKLLFTSPTIEKHRRTINVLDRLETMPAELSGDVKKLSVVVGSDVVGCRAACTSVFRREVSLSLSANRTPTLSNRQSASKWLKCALQFTFHNRVTIRVLGVCTLLCMMKTRASGQQAYGFRTKITVAYWAP